MFLLQVVWTVELNIFYLTQCLFCGIKSAFQQFIADMYEEIENEHLFYISWRAHTQEGRKVNIHISSVFITKWC